MHGSNSHRRPGRTRRRVAALPMAGILAAGMLIAAAPAAPAATTPGCTSTTDCLSKMTLGEKAGQMTQAAWNYLKSDSDISTYGLGSLLSGGGGGPNGAGGTAAQWKSMVDNFQSYALNSRLGIPLLYGVDAVHGHNNVDGAVIFPHNIGMGATRDAQLVERAARVTAEELAGTGINWTFAPCIAVARDPRWGRTYESFGETPELAELFAPAAIRGLRG